MATVEIKGIISSDENAEVYEWFGYDTVSPSRIKEQLDGIDDGEDVIVNIGSNGGEVTAGSEIYTMLRQAKNNVEVHVTSLAASAASFIAMAGDKVLMSPTAQMMIHRASTGAEGNRDAMSQAGQMLDSTDQMLVDVYKAKTGLSKPALCQMLKDETWLNANDAIKLGFADGKMFDDVPEETDVVANPAYNAFGLINLSANKIASVKAMLHPKPVPDDGQKLIQDNTVDSQLVKEKLAILFG
ncbi:Clp protease ClpP [Lactobacillus delbrueckii subsp. lactis]|uniref:head maturation protease, ClpP-related n=1 Tax=Lactobacillus delbrueckii TaxID=1584 RepID=UPI001E3DD11E|nr:Clp protease ClpP [Lactobacillus delbrueckii subsp. lactis]